MLKLKYHLNNFGKTQEISDMFEIKSYEKFTENFKHIIFRFYA